jgi:hypothetical protein
MHPTPAPCLGCTLFCERRGGRRISKEAREKCKARGGNLVAPGALPLLQLSPTPEDRTYPCEHRGKDSLGLVPCLKCGQRGTKLKTFVCGSPEVSQSVCTIDVNPGGKEASCASCEVRTLPGSVLRDQVAAGITSAPRKKPRLAETFASLCRAGFDNVTVFTDGYGPEDFEQLGDALDGACLIERPYPLGGWSNFYLSLSDLYHRFPTAGLYAMFQDDVLACEGLADYLKHTVDNSYPVWSAFQMEFCGLTKQGWNRIDHGFQFCGAQALVFTNEGVRQFLSDPDVVRYRRFPNAEGKYAVNDGRTHIDGVVGRYARKTKKGVAVHHPSLVKHVGDTSVMHGPATLNHKRRSEKYFLGERYPLNAPPSVGCLMISGGSPDRKKFIRFAIEDFLAQDYDGHSALVIFDYHEEPILWTDGIANLIAAPEKQIVYFHKEAKTMGMQRQEILDYARVPFPLLLQWDDDDRVPRDYLSYRVSTCPPGAASILTRQTFFYEDGRPDAKVSFEKDKFPGFPGTIMFPSCFDDVRYEDRQYREDTLFMQEIAKRTTLLKLPNDPSIYFRRVHGTNIVGDKHFEDLTRRLKIDD